jgi:hypothetical protein
VERQSALGEDPICRADGTVGAAFHGGRIRHWRPSDRGGGMHAVGIKVDFRFVGALVRRLFETRTT